MLPSRQITSINFADTLAHSLVSAPDNGEVAEPGLRRTPGERVTSEGFRGFKSPPSPPASPHLTATLRLRTQNARLPADSRDSKVTGELALYAVKVFLADILSARE